MKRVLQLLALALLLIVPMASPPAAFAGSVPLITGPIDPSNQLATVNTAILSINSNIVGTLCTATGTTPQTCNGIRGVVTTGTLTTAAVTNAAFVINDSSVTTGSVIMCSDQGYSGTLVTNGEPVFSSCVPGTGTITVNITNVHATNALNGTIQIGFTVFNP